MAELPVKQTHGEVVFVVRVQPRAGRDSVDGVREGVLRVRLAAPPVEGEANEALCRFLAARLHLPKSAVRILSGERGRVKRIAVRGAAVSAVEALAGAADP